MWDLGRDRCDGSTFAILAAKHGLVLLTLLDRLSNLTQRLWLRSDTPSYVTGAPSLTEGSVKRSGDSARIYSIFLS